MVQTEKYLFKAVHKNKIFSTISATNLCKQNLQQVDFKPTQRNITKKGYLIHMGRGTPRGATQFRLD